MKVEAGDKSELLYLVFVSLTFTWVTVLQFLH